jgi:hypothetical protein
MTETIRVAVAAHKPYRMPADSVYLPLHVGRALHPENVEAMGPAFIGDDTGNNISALNAWYSELTGLYWIWKNLDADYKGLVHYRRHFATTDSQKKHSKDRFDRIATGDDFRAVLSVAPIVVPMARNYVIETIESHYRHTMPSEHVDVVRDVMAEVQPAFIPALNEVLSGTKAHMFNMFVMRSDALESYCSWLFPLLDEVTNRLDPAQYDAFNARYPGRISEWLLDVWLKTMDIPYIEMATTSPEPVNWGRKGTAFLAAKFLGRKYEGSF